MAQTWWLRKWNLGWDGILHPLQYEAVALHELDPAGLKGEDTHKMNWERWSKKWVEKHF